MAHLVRGKQAGVQNDFSSNVQADIFAIDDVGLPHTMHALSL